MSIRSLSLAVLLVGPHRCALSSLFKAPDQNPPFGLPADVSLSKLTDTVDHVGD